MLCTESLCYNFFLFSCNFRKKESIWRYKPSVSISEPQAFMRSAFYVAVEKDWQGLAYVMLEVAKLPFIDAFKVILYL